jgi:hypothetical protein
MCNTDLIKTQAILWKAGHAKGRSLQEKEGKRRKLRR